MPSTSLELVELSTHERGTPEEAARCLHGIRRLGEGEQHNLRVEGNRVVVTVPAALCKHWQAKLYKIGLIGNEQ